MNQQNEIQQHNSRSSLTLRDIVIAIAVTALVVGGGVFNFWGVF